MSYDIQIKVDAPGAPATIAGVQKPLEQLEKTGKATQSSMTGVSASMKSLASALAVEEQALKRSIASQNEQITARNASARASQTWQAALLREHEMLDQIHGPAQKMAQDLETLNSLMAQGSISAEQYASQVAKVKSGSSGGLGGALSGAAGEVGIGGLAGGGAIALIQQVGGFVDELDQKFRKASDDATDFYNHALKFVDGGHNTNQVLAEQKQLAHDLHAPLAETMDLYDGIGDATSELNLSQRQLAEITKTVGEATTIANKPLASAGDIISRLAVGFEAGGDASRSVKKLIADYKDLADVWTSAFHTSKSGLLEMVRDHKLSFEQMTLALGTNTNATHEAFALRHRTYADEKAELESLAAFYQKDGMSEEMALLKAKEEYDALDEAIKPLSERFALLADNSKSAAQSIAESNTMLQTWTAIATSIGVANQADLKVGGEYISAREHAIKDLAGLEEARKEGLIKGAGAAEFYRKTWESLTATIDGRLPAAYQIQMRLSDATEDFHRNLEGLDSLFAQHKIRLDQYLVTLHQITDAYAGSEIRKVFDQLNTAPSSADLQGHQQALIAQDRGDTQYRAGSEAPMTQTAAAAEHYRLELAQLNEMIERNVVDQDQAAARLKMMNAEYNKAVGAVDENVQRQHDLQAMLDSIKKPQQDYAHDLDIVNQLLHDGAIGAEEYADRVAKIRDAYSATQKHSQDFATGLEHGWNDIVKEATDSAGQIETAMKGAFSAVEDSITNMVMKGQFDLNSLGSSLEQILVKLAVQQAIGGIVGAIGPIGGGSVPHFATGGSGTVGGSGGTDSQLFIARVTPGEQYTFTPPGQPHMASAGPSSGGIVHNHYYTYDPKAVTKQIQGEVMNQVRQNRTAINSLLGR